jgi:GH25 family lysozyme M1 (1,4-beta-N-acetylmuramidase)
MIRGCDVSFQCPGAAIKAAGLVFAISECSIGMGTNASHVQNIADWQANGLAASVYHYAIFTNDPTAEANHLCDLIEKLPGRGLDFPACVDVEMPKNKTDLNLPLPAPQIIAWLETFVTVYKNRMGHYPMVYTYPSYGKMLGAALAGSKVLGLCPLWIADYFHGMWPADGTVTVVCDPKSPWFLGGPWTDYAVMQTKGNTNVPGIPTIVDTDVAQGTVDDLRALFTKDQPSIGPLPPSPLPGLAGQVVSGRAGFAVALLAAIVGGGWWLARRGRK